MIPKGELVQFDYRKKLWHLSVNPSIEVSCQHGDVTIISSLAILFLTAIPDPGIRFETFTNSLNDFNRVVKSTIGDEVNVLLDITNNKKALKAVIKYKGDLPEQTGHYFGVELLVSIYIW